MFRLPVSGMNVLLREPTGIDDVLLAEAPAPDTSLALELISRLAEPLDEAEVSWDALTPTDLDALLLMIRRSVLGENISGNFSCPSEACGARVDIAFQTGDYLANQQPAWPRDVEEAEERGWFRFRGAKQSGESAESEISFRLPTGNDQIVIRHQPDPVSDLIRRCVRPARPPARMLRRIEKAMESLAPSPATNLQGVCPECGESFELRFDPQSFSLRELRDQAAFIYEDVHLIAQHYRWSEAEIMSLPRRRRLRYAEFIRQEKGYE